MAKLQAAPSLVKAFQQNVCLLCHEAWLSCFFCLLSSVEALPKLLKVSFHLAHSIRTPMHNGMPRDVHTSSIIDLHTYS